MNLDFLAENGEYVGIDEVGNLSHMYNGVCFFNTVPEAEAFRSKVNDDLGRGDIGLSGSINVQEVVEVVAGLNADPGDGVAGTGGCDVGVTADDNVTVNLDSDTDEDDLVVVEELGAEGELVLRILDDLSGGGADVDADVADGRDGCSMGAGKISKASPEVLDEPREGMVFNSGVEFVGYMHRYGQSVGHGVFIRGSYKDKKEKLPKSVVKEKKDKLAKWFNLEDQYKKHWKIRMWCRKGGKHKSKSCDPDRSTESCKTECPYVVNACRTPRSGTTWRITKVEGKHNHDLVPDLCRLLPRYRRISLEDQIIATQLNRGGVGMAKVYDVFVNRYKSFEEVPFTEQDLRNFIYFSNRKPLKDTDFARMEVHFKKMREESPNFFYEYDVDDKFQLHNVFWADSRCREAFREFGDVVSFDTTFVTNRYKMPFAVFVGVNNFGKSILFGCALIGREDKATFEWLFRTWKTCMGKAPGCILTDQDKAIGSAIASEFPGISHRWCIWHVMCNFRKHNGMRKDWKELYAKFQTVLHDSFSVEEFEREWEVWVADYGLGSSSWVNDMYKDRFRWVPIYFKSNFWVGMSSTQRSEGMHHYLKGFVNINTSLTKFVKRYGKAVCKRISEENTDSLISGDRRSRKTTRHVFESIFEKMYTRPKFKEFHDELYEMNENTATIKHMENEKVVYDVLVKDFRVGWTKRQNFRVSFDRLSLEVKCECQNFEFRGILCAHALRVFWVEETQEVPERYICSRWRKDIPRKYLTEAYPAASLIGVVQIEAERYEEINRVAQEICVKVMHDEKLHKEVLAAFRSLNNKIDERMANPEGLTSYVRGGVGKVYRSLAIARDGGNDAGYSALNLGEEEMLVKDPIDKRGRGRGPTKRKKPMGERIMSRRVRGRGSSSAEGGRGLCGSTPNTPAKDVEQRRFQGESLYAPEVGNVLRHGFKVKSSTGNICVGRGSLF